MLVLTCNLKPERVKNREAAARAPVFWALCRYFIPFYLSPVKITMLGCVKHNHLFYFIYLFFLLR